MEKRIQLESVQPGDRVLAALSGGADSVALLHILKNCGILAGACHVNHCLRGEESVRDQQFVEDLCSKWQIPLFLLKEDVKELSKQLGCSVEEAGRHVRYEFFEKTAGELEQAGAGKIWVATAHTLSDQVETVLFHLTRGSGLHGLCGIPSVRGRIIRPLLNMTRNEIEEYCQEYGLDYVTDSTNLCADYARNRIRLEVIPALKQINSGLERNVGRMIAGLEEDERFLEEQVLKAWEQAYLPGFGLTLKLLRDFPVSVRRRAVFRLLEQFEVEPSSFLSERGEELIRQGKGKVTVGSGKYLQAADGVLTVQNEQIPLEYWEIPLFTGDFHSPSGKSYQIKILETTSSQRFHNLYKNLFAISLDCGKICGSVTIRQKKDGDRVKLVSSPYTKSLKKLFQEKGIAPEERKKRFVLADQQGVIAVEGFGVSQRVCCDEHTDKMIVIEERGI
ncbi:MAG: tRNA lysidine(34) synthetase TilS [Massiliimalia sp.]|jgi:tRNA(Ile)-lysidine synthase